MSRAGKTEVPPGSESKNRTIVNWDQFKPIEELEKQIEGLPIQDRYTILKGDYALLYELLKKCDSSQEALLDELSTKKSDETKLQKNIALRERLENVCRELQHQNKKLKEEYTEKLRAEEQRRKSTAHQFQSRLTDLTKLLEDSKIQSQQAHKDNSNMGRKLKELCAQFQKRELELTTKAMEADNAKKNFDAEINKLYCQYEAQKLLHQKEVEKLNLQLHTSEQECQILRKATETMQKHLTEYKNRYSEIEVNLTKSTKMFEKCKKEMEVMTEHHQRMDGENMKMKLQQYEQHALIAKLNELVKKQETTMQYLDKRCKQIEKLCRKVQVDRAYYLKLLRANNIQIDESNCNLDQSNGEDPLPDQEQNLPDQSGVAENK